MSSLATVTEVVCGQTCEEEASSGDGHSEYCNTLITTIMGNNNGKLQLITGSRGDRSSQGWLIPSKTAEHQVIPWVWKHSPLPNTEWLGGV